MAVQHKSDLLIFGSTTGSIYKYLYTPISNPSTPQKDYIMFGFGKKKLDDRLAGGIMIEVGMYQSWSLDMRGIDLRPDILETIIERIMKRENIKYSNEELHAIKSMTILNMEFDQMREFRKKTNFDGQVVGFCKSIGLPSEFYTPKR